MLFAWPIRKQVTCHIFSLLVKWAAKAVIQVMMMFLENQVAGKEN